MAIDWQKEVSFKSIGGILKRPKSSGDNKYPTKTTMNLYVVESSVSKTRIVPIAVLLVVIVALFVKFGVIDQYARLRAKEAELSQQQLIVAQTEKQLENYDNVLATYQGFASTGDPNAVDAISVLDLVTTQVMPYANVSGIVLEEGVLTLTLSGTSLSTVGDLATHLGQQDMVESVSVSTASNNANSGSGDVATLTMKLTNGAASTIASSNTNGTTSSSSAATSSSSAARK